MNILAQAQQFHPESYVSLVHTAGGIAFITLLCLAGIARSMYLRRQFEQSRREVAAYVAEGSMTPEDAERLLDAGPYNKNKNRR